MRFTNTLLAALALSLPACGAADTDGDLLSDAFEELIGTSTELADSDGDGFTDAEEYLAYFDPEDGDDFPYSGNYPRGPLPSELEGSGWGQGDISEDWSGLDQHGEELSLHKFYGNVVLIDIGSEWCNPCNQAAPEAEEHYQDYIDEGFMVVGMLLDGLQQDSPPDVDRWIEEHELTYAVLDDSDQDKTQHYIPESSDGSFGIPLFALIGRDLTISIHGAGASDWSTEDIEDLLGAEAPYVEWPMPENTGDLRASLGIDVPSHHDDHLDDNIQLTQTSIGAGSVVTAGNNGAGGGSEADGNTAGQGSSYTPAHADGSYSGAPWGGADCSVAQGRLASPLSLLLLGLGLLGLRRSRT